MTRIPEGVGWTALLTAYGRAQESRETVKLFDDPLASMFVAAVADAGVSNGGKLPRLAPAVDDGSSALWNAFRFYFCERTPFYDQRVLRAVEDGCHQVVLLAAGLTAARSGSACQTMQRSSSLTRLLSWTSSRRSWTSMRWSRHVAGYRCPSISWMTGRRHCCRPGSTRRARRSGSPRDS